MPIQMAKQAEWYISKTYGTQPNDTENPNSSSNGHHCKLFKYTVYNIQYIR